MAEAGILHEDDRVELIEGEIVEMTAIVSAHAACVRRLIYVFTPRVEGRALVSAQNPVRLSEHSEPQPDLALLQPRADYYGGAHPGPQDVLLLVEVADTSYPYDRGIKLPLYARSTVREVWLVDLAGDKIEVYRGPSPQGYQQVQQVRRGERLAVEAEAEVHLAVDDILGSMGGDASIR